MANVFTKIHEAEMLLDRLTAEGKPEDTVKAAEQAVVDLYAERDALEPLEREKQQRSFDGAAALDKEQADKNAFHEKVHAQLARALKRANATEDADRYFGNDRFFSSPSGDVVAKTRDGQYCSIEKLVETELPASLRQRGGGKTLEDKIADLKDQLAEQEAIVKERKRAIHQSRGGGVEVTAFSHERKKADDIRSQLAELTEQHRHNVHGAPEVKQADPVLLSKIDDARRAYDRVKQQVNQRARARGESPTSQEMAQVGAARRTLQELERQAG